MKSDYLAAANPARNPELWVKLYDDYLRRFAHSKVNNFEIVNDLVQDTFVAALSSLENFQQRASVKTWLTGILRKKIVDYYRTYRRELPLEDFIFDVVATDVLPDCRRWWSAWSGQVELNPEDAFEQMEFLLVLGCCLARLPARQAYVFIQYAWFGLSTEEICKNLSISRTNCWVMLHRSRKFLRHALETDWVRV